MEKQKLRRPSTPTVLSLLALIVATWGVFIGPSGAGGGQINQQFIKTYESKSDCPPNVRMCAVLTDNSVSQDAMQNNAIGALETINRSLTGTDIDQLVLRNVDNVFPTLLATADDVNEPAPFVGKYMGDGGANPLNSLAENYDTVTKNPSSWSPCVGTGDAADFPCFKVPADGTYLLNIRVVWANNTTGPRLVVVDEWGTACDQSGPGGYRTLIGNWDAAADLPYDSNTSGRIQQYSVVADLEKDDCIGTVFRQDSGSDLTFDVTFSATMQ